MQTRLRSASSSQERRNSVSEITEFFQAKVTPPSSPIMAPHSTRKTSGCKDNNREKEKDKDIKEVRENIKAYLNKIGDLGDNANGGANASSSSSANKEIESPERDSTNCETHVETNGDQHDGNREDISPKATDNSANDKTVNSVHTQTNEDEILKAIQELASKYQQVDEDLNDPKKGIAYQLSKTQSKVTEIHTEIYGAVSGIKAQLSNLTTSVTSNTNKIIQMENTQKRMAALLEENKRIVRELKVMQGIVSKVSSQTDVNSSQLLDLTKRGMEQNLVLYGVDESLEVEDIAAETPKFTHKERCKYSALKFLKEELNIDLGIEDIWKAHRMGFRKQDKVRPLIIKISYAAKDLIMEHLGNLKGRFNPVTKQKYFISEQIPEGLIEARKQTSARLKSIKDQNDKKPKEARDKVLVVGDKILVNDQLDEPEIKTPSPLQLFLSAKEQEEVDVLQNKFVETEPEFMRNSEFLALAIKVHSLQEVKQAYIAAVQRYPAADHIILGYALKEEGKLKSGFCDDKEFGAGVRIKDLLFRTKTRNAAVFVMRKYGGVHLGFQRFGIIEKSAKQAIDILNVKFQ